MILIHLVYMIHMFYLIVAKEFISVFQSLAVVEIQAEEVFSQKAERGSKALGPRDQVLGVYIVTGICSAFLSCSH